jgi:hypothetical protein
MKSRLCGGAFLSIAFFFFAAMSTHAEGILIGYSNCVAVANYPQSMMDRIGQLKWYFTHASVGENMISGIGSLHSQNPAFYQISSVAVTNKPISSPKAGTIYEYDRGNSSWHEKFDLFQSCVGNGWHEPVVNIAVNKLCFIDSDAVLSWSLDYIHTLETSYPQTMFIYTTIPVTTGTDISQYNRNVYNDGMRQWCRTNNRVLLDIADIESHDPTGNPVTFTYNGRVCQQLYTGYAVDEGHLNPAGCELAAKGFYAVAAAYFSMDRDGDGLSDGEELIAGTNPTNAESALKLIAMPIVDENQREYQWPSVSNRFYSLDRKVSFAGAFTTILTDVPATPPTNTFTDTARKSGAVFYRLRVRQ